ncbi:2-hydroxyacid dehydrogenase [Longitalea arenae]|uniref:2-hydroxyacid dehydrogenase n=1 Tax=Longitalea arenae TaxID=2812558 RepID=UPI001967861D|nr:2-hydroxyacid dehydrogenase [Longitalea arenae]
MKILVTAPYNDNGLETLQEHFGEVIYRPWKPNGRAYYADELTALLKETGAHALITEHDHVTAEVIDACSHLQFIGVCRGTPSNVALATATKHGIPVFYTPARNAQAVAEMFIANVITFMRNTMAGVAWLKGRNWAAGAHTSYLQFKGTELAGKTVGMVGFGAIGQLIASMLQCYPCPIQFYDPYVNSFNENYRSVSLDELFATSDIVSIHLPVTEQTKGLIDYSLLSKMKPGAIFVNTARAVVVKREDLLRVLEEGAIRGAILDVFDHEPPDEMDYKIIDHPNVLATPHIAGATFEVEDHHVTILNKTLVDWYVHNKRTGARLANKELLTVQI